MTRRNGHGSQMEVIIVVMILVIALAFWDDSRGDARHIRSLTIAELRVLVRQEVKAGVRAAQRTEGEAKR